MAILYRLATTHFQHTHPSRHDSDPMPITMQMTFLRRTAVGPARLTVHDLKLGARTSTIYVTLSQGESDSSSRQNQGQGQGQGQDPAVKIVGFITVSSPAAEVGLTYPNGWTLQPPQRDTRPPQLVVQHGEAEEEEEQVVPGSPWKKISTPHSNFRRVSKHSRVFVPAVPAGGHGRGITDQWALLRPSGSKGGRGRWTNDTLPHLADVYPTALGDLDHATARAEKQKGSISWYPTVTLNIDFKKRLPPDGVEWMYSRVVTKSVRNGRTDFEVVMMDEAGAIVALATQVGLVVSSSRNVDGRSSKESREKEKVAPAKI
jgi:hypothetical protein